MKVAILEKDAGLFKQMESLIKNAFQDWDVIRYLSSFSMVTGVVDELKGDVNLLMIHIPPNKYEFIRMARDLQEYYSHIHVIFYSEDNDCAEQIFTAVPSFFLHLPFEEVMFASAMDRVASECHMEEGQTINLKFRGEIQKIKFRSILYIESIGRKVRIYTSTGRFEAYKTMSEIMETLPPQFQQCHRSYVVNTDKIIKITLKGVLLGDMEFVPVSRTFYKTLKKICSNI